MTSSSLPLPRLQRARGEADPPVAYCCKVEHVVLNALAKQMQGRLIFASSSVKADIVFAASAKATARQGRSRSALGGELASFAREFPPNEST